MLGPSMSTTGLLAMARAQYFTIGAHHLPMRKPLDDDPPCFASHHASPSIVVERAQMTHERPGIAHGKEEPVLAFDDHLARAAQLAQHHGTPHGHDLQRRHGE